MPLFCVLGKTPKHPIKPRILKKHKPIIFSMKRNINMLVLTLEIAAIIILHTIKMSNVQLLPNHNTSITKIKITAPVVKHYTLLSIK